MDLVEAMTGMGTMRRLRPDPVPVEILRRVLDHARFAPSGGNRQGWRVIAASDPQTRRALRDLYLPSWREYLEQTGGARILAFPEEAPASRVKAVRQADAFAEHLDEVPLHLLILAHVPSLAIVDTGLGRPSIVGGASIYPFVQNILLGLRAEGLGAALTTLIAPAEEGVRRLLGFPEDVVIAAHVAVGWPDAPWPTRLSRRPVDEFAFGERWGEPLAES